MFCPGEAGDQKDLAVGGSFQLLYSFCCGMAARFFCCNTTNIHCGCREHTVSSQGGAQLSMCPCKRAYLRAKKSRPGCRHLEGMGPLKQLSITPSFFFSSSITLWGYIGTVYLCLKNTISGVFPRAVTVCFSSGCHVLQVHQSRPFQAQGSLFFSHRTVFQSPTFISPEASLTGSSRGNRCPSAAGSASTSGPLAAPPALRRAHHRHDSALLLATAGLTSHLSLISPLTAAILSHHERPRQARCLYLAPLWDFLRDLLGPGPAAQLRHHRRRLAALTAPPQENRAQNGAGARHQQEPHDAALRRRFATAERGRVSVKSAKRIVEADSSHPPRAVVGEGTRGCGCRASRPLPRESGNAARRPHPIPVSAG